MCTLPCITKRRGRSSGVLKCWNGACGIHLTSYHIFSMSRLTPSFFVVDPYQLSIDYAGRVHCGQLAADCVICQGAATAPQPAQPHDPPTTSRYDSCPQRVYPRQSFSFCYVTGVARPVGMHTMLLSQHPNTGLSGFISFE